MRIILVIMFVALALLSLPGCGTLFNTTPVPTIGWQFSVGRPSTMQNSSATILNPQTGPIGLQPTGNLSGTSNTIIHTPPPPMTPTVSGRAETQYFVCPPNACSPQCDCNTLDKKLDTLLQRSVPAREE